MTCKYASFWFAPYLEPQAQSAHVTDPDGDYAGNTLTGIFCDHILQRDFVLEVDREILLILGFPQIEGTCIGAVLFEFPAVVRDPSDQDRIIGNRSIILDIMFRHLEHQN